MLPVTLKTGTKKLTKVKGLKETRWIWEAALNISAIGLTSLVLGNLDRHTDPVTALRLQGSCSEWEFLGVCDPMTRSLRNSFLQRRQGKGPPWWSSGWDTEFPMQGAQVWSLVREDPTCHVAWWQKKKKGGGRNWQRKKIGKVPGQGHLPGSQDSLDLSPPAPHLQNSGQLTQIISLSSLRFLSYKSRKNNCSYSEILWDQNNMIAITGPE